jgi:hypothetical protein
MGRRSWPRRAGRPEASAGEHLLELGDVLLGDLGLHRAVLGSAHRAELGLFVDIGRKGFFVVLPGPLGVERQIELAVPVEGVAGATEFIVAVAGAGAMSAAWAAIL